jgi:hypothetical protein
MAERARIVWTAMVAARLRVKRSKGDAMAKRTSAYCPALRKWAAMTKPLKIVVPIPTRLRTGRVAMSI